MEHKRILPPRHLSTYIRFFWTLEYDGIASHDSLFKVFARRFPRMVFQHHNGNSGIYYGKNYLPLAYLSGLNTRPYDCGIHPSITTLGVSFYPHAIKPIFGIDACEIVNELPDITNFVSPTLVHQLVEAKTVDQRIRLLSRFFTWQLHNNSYTDKLSEQAWKLLIKESDESQVLRLTRVFNVSERQLQRQFKASIGLAPKQYLKISRFEKAIRLLQTAKPKRIAEIAYELGFSDQSHFIREFRQLSGQTPTAYLKLNKLYDENSAFIVKDSRVSLQ